MGFCKGLSAAMALHMVVGALEEANQYNKEIHVAYIDCCKAFDSLHHNAIF